MRIDRIDHLVLPVADLPTTIEGPGPQTGARGRLQSVYLRDPDGNLLEISNELPD